MPRNTDVIVYEDVFVLESNDGDHLEGFVAERIGQTCRQLKTRGDGACGIHAVFGEVDPRSDELRCEHPRRLLQAVLAQPLESIRGRVRPTKSELVDAVASSLWADFVVPYVGDDFHGPPSEEGMFLERLQSSPLWVSVLDRVMLNRALQEEADEREAKSRMLSASIFRRELDAPVWAVMAIAAGLMPPAPLLADSGLQRPADQRTMSFWSRRGKFATANAW